LTAVLLSLLAGSCWCYRQVFPSKRVFQTQCADYEIHIRRKDGCFTEYHDTFLYVNILRKGRKAPLVHARLGYPYFNEEVFQRIDLSDRGIVAVVEKRTPTMIFAAVDVATGDVYPGNFRVEDRLLAKINAGGKSFRFGDLDAAREARPAER
jgi:hypothetical protein